jgi:hypothetical protein
MTVYKNCTCIQKCGGGNDIPERTFNSHAKYRDYDSKHPNWWRMEEVRPPIGTHLQDQVENEMNEDFDNLPDIMTPSDKVCTSQ